MTDRVERNRRISEQRERAEDKEEKKKRALNHNRHQSLCRSPILLLPHLLLMSLPSLKPLDPGERQPGLLPLLLALASGRVRAFRRSLPKLLM